MADNHHIWLEDAPCTHDASLTCAAVESRTKKQKSGYSRRVSFIDLAEYRVHRIDFYNRRATWKNPWSLVITGNIWMLTGAPM